jgi:hypothetical protein
MIHPLPGEEKEEMQKTRTMQCHICCMPLLIPEAMSYKKSQGRSSDLFHPFVAFPSQGDSGMITKE